MENIFFSNYLAIPGLAKRAVPDPPSAPWRHS